MMRIPRQAIASLIAAAFLSGCASPAGEPIPVPSSATPTPAPSPSASPSDPSAQEVEVFFAHAHTSRITLVGERRPVDAPDDAALEAVLGGVISGEIQPIDADYTNLWGYGSALLSVSNSEGVLEIDLRPGNLNLGAEAESVAIQQLVWTATTMDPSVTAIRLLLEGAPAETLTGHVDISSPIEPGAPESRLSPLHITSPAEGAVVMAPVRVGGEACVFEATFSWELQGPGGSVVDGVGMASEACPTRAEWTLDLGDLAPGAYVLTVLEYSMQDGSVSSADSKSFTVAG